jgi:hypothetical protein
MKIAKKNKSNYLGYFIGALVVQLILFFLSSKGGDYSSAMPISRVLIPVSIVVVIADIFCITRILLKAEKKWFDILALIGAYLPLSVILYYFYVILILIYAIIGCAMFGCDM